MDELKQVADYKKALGEAGVLYCLFKNERDLQSAVRNNLQRSIMDFLAKQISLRHGAEAKTEQAPKFVEEEPGFLDHLERAEEAVKIAAASLTRITTLIEEIGAETNAQVSEVERISTPAVGASEKKAVINGFASFLKLKANELKREATVTRENFDIFVSSFIVASNVQRQDGEGHHYKESIALFLAEAEKILTTIPESRVSVMAFKVATENIPRITIQFNQAKKALVEALTECLAMFDQTEKGIYEITAGT